MNFAGTPPTTEKFSTSFVTTAPDAIIEPLPITTRQNLAPAPIHTLSSITVLYLNSPCSLLTYLNL